MDNQTKRQSRIEILTRQFFAEIFEDEEPICNYRPDWLKNKKTGRNLELDIFYPLHKCAIEVNGPFHTLKQIKKRDTLKWRSCVERGIWYEGVRGVEDLWKIRRRIQDSTGEEVRLSSKLYFDLQNYKPNPNYRKEEFEFIRKKENAHYHHNRMSRSLKKYYQKANQEKILNLERLLRKGLVDQNYYNLKQKEYGLTANTFSDKN